MSKPVEEDMIRNNIKNDSDDYKFENEKIQKEFRDLKKRIKATRKSRLQASKRLRTDHNYYEKIINLYSLLLLVLSVWTLGAQDDEISTNILLISSLALTYLTMFLNIKNFKERAAKFESNYQDLDILTNKMDRYEASYEIIVNTALLKQLQREYEKSIVGNENHLDIDFYISQYNKDNWNSNEKTAHEIKKEQDLKRKILKYNFIARIKKIMIALFPILIIVLIKAYNYILAFFHLTNAT
jgi:hypothetical protein